MDIDLLADISNEGQPALSGDLLSNLPDRTLTHDSTSAPISPSRTVNNNQAGAAVSKIENIFEEIAGCILDEKKRISIKLKTRGKQSTIARDAITGTIKSLQDEETRTVQFPSRSPKEAWKFSESSKRLNMTLADMKQLHYCGFLSCLMKLWLRALLLPKGLTSMPPICITFHLKSGNLMSYMQLPTLLEFDVRAYTSPGTCSIEIQSSSSNRVL